MQPLQLAVGKALAALGVPKQASDCRLLHSNKPLDLAQPYRFAGLPNNPSLVLDTGAQWSACSLLVPGCGCKASHKRCAGEGPQLGLDARVPHSGQPAHPAVPEPAAPAQPGSSGPSTGQAASSQPATQRTADLVAQEACTDHPPAQPRQSEGLQPAHVGTAVAPSLPSAPASEQQGSAAAAAEPPALQPSASAEASTSQPVPAERPYRVFSRTELHEREAAQVRCACLMICRYLRVPDLA